MSKNIIVDTSCLILLEKIDELNVLKKLFNTIVVTSVVAEEFGSDLPGWIKIKSIKNKQYQKVLETTVDRGEASAIALAVEIQGLLVLDDLKARKLALKLELDYTGTLGVLIDGVQSGYIDSFTEVLKRIKQTNFHLSKDMEKKLIEMINE